MTPVFSMESMKVAKTQKKYLSLANPLDQLFPQGKWLKTNLVDLYTLSRIPNINLDEQNEVNWQLFHASRP